GSGIGAIGDELRRAVPSPLPPMLTSRTHRALERAALAFASLAALVMLLMLAAGIAAAQPYAPSPPPHPCLAPSDTAHAVAAVAGQPAVVAVVTRGALVSPPVRG